MNNKYVLTDETIDFFGRTLYRIKAISDFGNIKAGKFGGFIENEKNLSISGNAWVFGDAKVYGDAEIYGNAEISGDARIYDDAKVYGNAEISGNARVSGDAKVYGNAEISGDARIYGNAEISGDARIYGNAWVFGDARISGDAKVYCNADYTTIKGFGTNYRNTTFFRCKDDLVRVKCGCFFGTIPEFREQVKKTRKGKIADEYLMIADLMEMHFKK